MVALAPPVCDFGWEAPAFSLLGTDNMQHNLNTVRGENGLLLMFICNHCPFVKSIVARLVVDCRAVQELKIGVAAIMSNDVTTYSDDSFDKMVLFGVNNGFTFPYLYDEKQQVARDYGAVCTPDFFGFNRDLELHYRGRLDEGKTTSPPKGAKRELLDAMTKIAKTGQGPVEQKASIGCSIKWR